MSLYYPPDSDRVQVTPAERDRQLKADFRAYQNPRRKAGKRRLHAERERQMSERPPAGNCVIRGCDAAVPAGTLICTGCAARLRQPRGNRGTSRGRGKP